MGEYLCDIVGLDRKIMKNFEQERLQLENLKKQFVSCKNVKDKKDLSNKINILSNNDKYGYYIMDAQPLVAKFTQIRDIPVTINFSGKKGHDHFKPLREIAETYIQIVRQIGIDISLPEIKPKKIKIVCRQCNSKNLELIEDRVYVCVDCGEEIQEIMSTQPVFRENDNSLGNTQYKYERRVHFRDCVKQFQAKQSVKIDKQVYTDLEEQFKFNNLIQDGKNNREKFSKITLGHINFFLRLTGWSKHYENSILIWTQFTGKKAHDISHLEQLLYDDFDILEEVYYSLPDSDREDRTNFPNSQYILFELLLKYNFKCSPEYFHILKTEDRLAWHNEITNRMFKLLGWPFTHIRL